MMKTSKKILSLFLAVVMVITTCSVGFTAFADDKSNEGDAFDAVTELVNTYVPQLANGPLKDLLTSKLGMTVTDKTTLQDIIAGASPTLLKALGSKGNKQKIITDYYKEKFGKNPSEAEHDYKTYSELGMYDYLDDADASMDFYALYQFCSDTLVSSESSKEAKEYAEATLPELKKLLQKHLDAFNNIYDEGTNDIKGTEALSEYKNEAAKSVDFSSDDLCLYDVENINVSGTLLKDVKDDKCSLKITYDNMFLDFEGCPIKIDNIASALFYQEKQNYVDGMFYLYLANLGGATVKYTNGEALTPSNYKEVIGGRNAYPDGERGDSRFEAHCLNEVYKTIFDDSTVASTQSGTGEFASPYYNAIATGVLELTKNYPTSKYKNAVEFVEDQQLTDEQIADLYAHIKASNKNDFTTYLASDNCKFSDYAKSFYKEFLGNKSNTAVAMIKSKLNTCKSSDEAVAMFKALRLHKNYATNNYTFKKADGDKILIKYWDAAYPNDPNAMPYYEIGRYMMPSVIVKQLSGKTTNAFGFYGTANIKFFYEDGNIGKIAKSALGDSAYKYSDFAIPNELAVEAVNAGINSYIDYLDPDHAGEDDNYYTLVNDLVSKLTDKISVSELHKTLKNVWKDLYKDPIEKIFELLPLAITLIDEVAIPLALNDQSPEDSALFGLKNLLKKKRQENASLTGIGNLSFDLNTILPAVLNWIIGNENDAKAILGNATYSFADFSLDSTKIHKDTFAGNKTVDEKLALKDELIRELDNITIVKYDDDGKQIILHFDLATQLADLESQDIDHDSKKYKDKYVEIYDDYVDFITNCNSVPKFLNIYVVDRAIYGFNLKGKFANILIDKSDYFTQNKEVADGVEEAVATVAKFLLEAVNEYLETEADRDIIRDTDGNIATKGLNNVFVALPKLIDITGRKFLKKYNVKSDWNYTAQITVSTEAVNNIIKALGAADSASKFFELFAADIVNYVINPLLDFLNDIIQDSNSDIAKDFLLVMGLLKNLGGFGEESIVSDVLNAAFGIKRKTAGGIDNENAFNFAKRTDGYMGLSPESGEFLIKELKNIIPFIITLIKGTDSSTSASTGATASNAPLLANSTKVNVTSLGTSYEALLTEENKEAAKSLIDALDKLLTSLLENTTLNNYKLNKTDNVLAAAATVASSYLGSSNTNAIVQLINKYFYYMVGESTKNPGANGKIGTLPKDGNVDKEKIYTPANLSVLVIETYSLVEDIVDYLFNNKTNGYLKDRDPNGIISRTVCGIISPDAVAVRMSDHYENTKKVLFGQRPKLFDTGIFAGRHKTTSAFYNTSLTWSKMNEIISDVNNDKEDYKYDYLAFGFNNGDKTAFYDALGESLSGVAGLIGTILATSYSNSAKTSNYYSIVRKVFGSINSAVGVKTAVMSEERFSALSDSDKLILGILEPISLAANKFFEAPATFLLNFIKGVGKLLDDTSVKVIVGYAIDPINYILSNVAKAAKNLSPILGKMAEEKLKISVTLPKKDIIVTLLNKGIGKLLNKSEFSLIPSINWLRLGNASSPEEVLLLVFGFAVDFILHNDFVQGIIDSLAPGLTDILTKFTSAELFNILTSIIAAVHSPTELYWTFEEYVGKLADKFVYPAGVTASDAKNAVAQLDSLVQNVFPLLSSLGVADIDGLDSIINDKLYTNEILTSLAKAVYGALSKGTAATVLGVVQVDVSPKGFAKYLMDTSYGRTFSSAAKTLKKAKSWDDVSSLNWGFTNGSSKAQAGFINGLAAVLRPFNNVLSVFLAQGKLDASKLDLTKVINELDLNGSTDYASGEYGGTLTYKLKKGQLTLTVRSNAKVASGKPAARNVVKMDLNKIISSIELLGDDINFGTNGYESAIIPILEAFMCKNVKTYKQYRRDYKKAKDNLLIDVLTPVLGLVKDVAQKPFDTLTKILPNVAYFIDNNGVTQALGNLLAPITSEDGLIGILKANGLNIDKLIKELTGKSLGKIITDALGIKGVKLNLKLTNLAASNIQDIVIPLVNSILKKNNLGIEIPDISFAKLASYGTIKTVKSAARNDEGKFTTRRITANQGEVLVAVFRYIADVLTTNAIAIKNLVTGIDAIKNNDTIKNIVTAVLNNLALAGKDDIVCAIFYLLNENATDRFFDYRNFKYKDGYEFSFGNMDEDFCRQLGPMLDGLVGGLLEGGLGGLVESKLYTDDLVAKLATGLYGAIEGVNVGDGNLTSLLAMTDIDFSTSNVASLLTNSKYGLTYPAAASIIENAGSWGNVKAEDLKFGVTDRASFLNAVVAVLRPIFGVVDVLLNDASLNLFNLIKIPGTDGYTSVIVPLFEAFGVYNIKTQYQYREDCYKAYDNVLLDIINPLWDKVEDILNAPIETLADILPNLSLFFANDGLLQIVENLFAPISALLEALKPIVNVNDILVAAGLDIPKLLKDKVGLNVKKFDIYDLSGTLKPLVGADNVVKTINSVLGIIKIKGTPLGIELPDIDWFKLASHGEFVPNATSQAATYGGRIAVIADQDETLIAVLRFLIDTINYKGNYDAIVNLITGILGDSVSDSISDVISQVLGMLKGDSDEVIEQLVDLLKQFA